jgi:trimeric autotransporter adhesin
MKRTLLGITVALFGFTNAVFAADFPYASTTIGNATQIGGLTISGGATTTGNSYVFGFFNTSGITGGYRIDGIPALQASSTNFSTVVGLFAAPFLNSSATGNTALGYLALNSATSSPSNTAVGYQALWGAGTNISSKGFNTALGYFALRTNTSGTRNIAAGAQALMINTTGSSNTALGYSSLFANTTGSNNVAIGDSALAAAASSTGNVAIGTSALNTQTFGFSNTAVGFEAGRFMTAGWSNTLIGNQAGLNLSTGYENVFIGQNAGRSATSTFQNTVVGVGAGQFLTRIRTSSGVDAGYGDTFMGYYAGNGNTTGTFNTFVGHAAGTFTTTGGSNTGFGRGVLNRNTTGSYNTAIGHGAGFYNTSGNFNVFIGDAAGQNFAKPFTNSNMTGSLNMFIGRYAAPAVEGLSNATAIGNFAEVSTSSSIVIGSASSTYAVNVGIATTSPFAEFSIATPDGASGSLGTLFAIASSTGSTTTTLLSVSNTGATTLSSNLLCAVDGGCVWGASPNRPSSVSVTDYLATSRLVFHPGRLLSGLSAIDVTNGPQTGAGILGFGPSADESRIPGLTGNSTALLLNLANGKLGASFGIGTTSPFSKFAIHADDGETNTVLFLIASSTANATTTLFHVTNTGSVVQDSAAAQAGQVMCYAEGGAFGHCTSAMDEKGSCACVAN